MYADTITDSMQQTIDETMRRRIKQMQYNDAHGITPTQITKSTKQSTLRSEIGTGESEDIKKPSSAYYVEQTEPSMAADPIEERMTRPQLEKSIANMTRLMKEAAKKLDFIQAAQYRDEIARMQKELEMK